MEMLCAATILKELECPVCVGYMHPPIRQCTVGHSFCDLCFEKLTSCPTCRSAKGSTRNYGLENLHQKLPFPCKNQLLGCSAIMLGADIRHHENVCPFAPLECPLKVIDDCNWRGDLNEIIAHCQEKHPTNVYIASTQTLTCKNFLKRNEEALKCYYILFKAHDQIFIATLQIDYRTKLMKWCVYHFASSSIEASANYSYEIAVQSRRPADDRKVALKSFCQPITNYLNTFSDKHCLLTHFDMIEKFCVDDDFIYTISIRETSN